MRSFAKEACSSCELAVVCRVLVLLHKHPELDMAMAGCWHYKGILEKQQEPRTEELPRISVEERMALMEELREENEPLEPIGHGKCESCGQDEVELLKCTKCGKSICGDCMTETFRGDVLCPECFDKDIPTLL